VTLLLAASATYAALVGCDCGGVSLSAEVGTVNCAAPPFTASSDAQGTFSCNDVLRPKFPCEIEHRMELWWWNPNTNVFQKLSADTMAVLSTISCDENIHTILCAHGPFTLPYHGIYFFNHIWAKSSGTWTGTDTATTDNFIC
jgi:hypothetical protein